MKKEKKYFGKWMDGEWSDGGGGGGVGGELE